MLGRIWVLNCCRFYFDEAAEDIYWDTKTQGVEWRWVCLSIGSCLESCRHILQEEALREDYTYLASTTRGFAPASVGYEDDR